VGVVAVPDARLGEVPVAAVEAEPGTSVATLEAWARDRLQRYQVPARIVIVDTLPRTPSLKVSRPALLQMIQRATAAREST
jgi:acyl-CoA synthetase (AMP-forming)/AMP-acid ligase II